MNRQIQVTLIRDQSAAPQILMVVLARPGAFSKTVA